MGLELELLSASKLPPIRTAAAASTASLDGGDNAAVLDECSTPTLAATVLPAPLVCPPAPRKPKPPAAKIRKLQRRGGRCGPAAVLRPAPVRRWFIAVPQDVLAAVFVARPAASAPPCPTSPPPASKKIRVHVTG